MCSISYPFFSQRSARLTMLRRRVRHFSRSYVSIFFTKRNFDFSVKMAAPLKWLGWKVNVVVTSNIRMYAGNEYVFQTVDDFSNIFYFIFNSRSQSSNKKFALFLKKSRSYFWFWPFSAMLKENHRKKLLFRRFFFKFWFYLIYEGFSEANTYNDHLGHSYEQYHKSYMQTRIFGWLDQQNT